ncbi:helix-turn-helix domain-containing protein [Desulfovibrio piger]|uniref:helix-turn-helix domain-containing protein n=1 Tax=Desulfovibrio piger TaxID=901 RepID=UPI0026ECB666|nr:helix-turn-helix domain-containing protein [Desulfovibrio piger]
MVLALEGGPDALGAWEPGPAASVRQLFSAELTPPDMEARMRYLQQCCRENALDLPREHLRLMARRAAHFHGLRSLLLRVKSAWEDDAARHPSLDDLERLARTGPVQACHAGHEQILAEAARCCDAAPADITGTGRHARLVMARQAAMYVCRRHLGLSYPELGRAFGGRDHSTVIHAVKKIGKMLESNKDVQHLVARLEKCAHQEQPDSSPTDEVFGA